MSKQDIKPGSSTVEGFFEWIQERTNITEKRMKGFAKPWTNDKIMQCYKFTNAFRQLDRGTVALHNYIVDPLIEELLESSDDITEDFWQIVFNVCWYRLFNVDTHARQLGYTHSMTDVREYIEGLAKRNEKIFTSAHMTTGVSGERKHVSYLRAVEDAFDKCQEIVEVAKSTRSMEAVFKALLNQYMVGNFIAYEMVCDLRFTPVLNEAIDKNTWGNVGPGAARGLKRLGMVPTVDAMYQLWNQAPAFLPMVKTSTGWKYPVHETWVPFELREIEHSLCEFDKYERTRTGVGTPRQKYDGTA